MEMMPQLFSLEEVAHMRVEMVHHETFCTFYMSLIPDTYLTFQKVSSYQDKFELTCEMCQHVIIYRENFHLNI